MSAAFAGALGHRAGLAAEAAVAEHYLRAGLSLVAKRWRGSGGEIDLIARDSSGLVFVEVKKSGSFARAAERVTPRQVARILGAAAEFLAGEPGGQDSNVRFDVALVNAIGEIEVLENAIGP
jgi:putative endonuclease